MNSVHDLNSDCKQCTESKLGWVHSAHTQGPCCVGTAPRPRARCVLGVVSWRTGCSILAPLLPCRLASYLIATGTRALSRYVATPLSQYKNCIACTCALLLCVTACLTTPFHDTKFCIATHSCGQAAQAHCSSPLRAGRSCRAWPCAPNCPVSQYSLMYHDSTPKMGSSPFQLPFLHVFFHLFYSLQDLKKKKKKNFISSIEPKIFIINFFFLFYTL